MYARLDLTSKEARKLLKELEEEGLVEHRVDASSFPVKSEYRLTECSNELIDVIRAMKMWALKWKIDNETCKKQNCRMCKL